MKKYLFKITNITNNLYLSIFWQIIRLVIKIARNIPFCHKKRIPVNYYLNCLNGIDRPYNMIYVSPTYIEKIFLLFQLSRYRYIKDIKHSNNYLGLQLVGKGIYIDIIPSLRMQLEFFDI